jgi:tripartite-type tricarboxylate transporter receptor subunit TctC
VSESGVPGYESSGWYALWAPAGTPRQILLKLNTDVTRILTSTAMKEQLAAQGLDPIPTSPEGFAKQLRVEIEKWGKVVRATGAKPQ